MNNLAPLYLLAALMVGPSLAADMSNRGLLSRAFQPMVDPEFYSGIVPATEASGLGKRQGSSDFFCAPGYYQCADGPGCCQTGTQCEVGTSKCLKPCGAGSTKCFDSCCDSGYSCVGPNVPCLKIVSVSTPVPTTPGTSIPGSTLVNSPTTIPATTKAATSSTTSVGPSTAISMTKDATSSTTLVRISTTISVTKDTSSVTALVNPSTTTPIRSTSTIADSGPTSPTTAEGEDSSSGKERVKKDPAPNGSNALKPGGWLEGLRVVLFFAFFYI